MHTIHTLRAWLGALRQPWPLAGLDVSADALFWVDMAPQSPGWTIQYQDNELLPAGWGDPAEPSTWDTLVLGSALQRLRQRAHAASRAAGRVPTSWVAMGLDAAFVHEHAWEDRPEQARSASWTPDVAESSDFCWDSVPAMHGAPAYRVGTPRSVVLAMQALTESAGLELSVLEPMQVAFERGAKWWTTTGTMPEDAWVRATGLALRRAHSWGWAC